MTAAASPRWPEPHVDGRSSTVSVRGLWRGVLNCLVQPMRALILPNEPWDWDDEDPLLARVPCGGTKPESLWS